MQESITLLVVGGIIWCGAELGTRTRAWQIAKQVWRESPHHMHNVQVSELIVERIINDPVWRRLHLLECIGEQWSYISLLCVGVDLYYAHLNELYRLQLLVDIIATYSDRWSP